jgi:indole-3-glycerol phosphate synthase
VGVNARDLRTFELDRDGFARLRPELPDDALAVAESGIRGPEEVVRAASEGADAVLVGESLVRAPDPRAVVAALVEAGRPADVIGPGPARLHDLPADRPHEGRRQESE